MKKILLTVILSAFLVGPVAAETTLTVSEQIKIEQQAEQAKKAAEKRAVFEQKKRAYIEGMRKAEKEAKSARDKDKKKEQVPQK